MGLRDRCPDDLVDPKRAGCQHDETVEAKCDAGCVRHAGERFQKVFVQRIGLAIDAVLLDHLRFKAPALLRRVRQFAKGIGQLNAAGINFEAFRDARIVRAGAGEGCFCN